MTTETKVKTSVISGWAFHCHHDVLVEYVYDYDERVAAIKADKPLDEQELRLRLFKMLPEDRLPYELLKARAAYDKAWAAYDKAGAAYDKARAACDRAAYDKARAARDKAWAAYDKARAARDTYFTELHKELCPNCPWDGKTIFSGKE